MEIGMSGMGFRNNLISAKMSCISMRPGMGTRLKSRIKTRPLLTTPSVGTIELLTHLSVSLLTHLSVFIC